MRAFTLVSAAAVAALCIPYLVRVVVGPTVFDRIVALNGIGTKVAVLLVLVGVLYDRAPMFIDLALGLFLLNLVTTLLIARYVREKGEI